MVAATLTSKGQTTIPASVREKLGLRAGDRLIFEEHDGGFVMRRAMGVEEIAGMLRGKVKPAFTSIEAEKAAAAETWAGGGMRGLRPGES